MEKFQKIKLNNEEYYIIDSMQDFRAEDSFIQNKNKLAQYDGNGEAKKHVGTYSGELGKKISHFFLKTHTTHTLPIFITTIFKLPPFQFTFLTDGQVFIERFRLR